MLVEDAVPIVCDDDRRLGAADVTPATAAR
jgi:hypothetical protein